MLLVLIVACVFLHSCYNVGVYRCINTNTPLVRLQVPYWTEGTWGRGPQLGCGVLSLLLPEPGWRKAGAAAWQDPRKHLSLSLFPSSPCWAWLTNVTICPEVGSLATRSPAHMVTSSRIRGMNGWTGKKWMKPPWDSNVVMFYCVHK